MNYPPQDFNFGLADPSDHSYYGSANTATTSAGMNPMSLDECSSGFQSASVSNFTSELPSSASTTINEFPPQRPPPPPPTSQPACMLPPPRADIAPSTVIEELSKYICNENDKVVLTNSLGILFSYSINSTRGPEVCQLMSASPVMLNALYNLLTSDQFKDDDPILFLATGNLTNLSKYEAGRAALVGCHDPQANDCHSRGVSALITSLQSRDSNVVIFAITAVHNLLLDRRIEVQERAKKQIKHTQGIKYIVRQLANQYLVNNYEFKVIVLDCLQILAYRNMENQLLILESDGPKLLLSTIMENFDNQPTEELVETASRVLKSLSACPRNKLDIIENDGIQILTRCIERDNQEILKTCLWTLRNLSDVIIQRESRYSPCVSHLVERLLRILEDYVHEPCIVTCALGTLANLTCNNEPIKQLICDCNGVDLLLKAIIVALKDSQDFRIANNEILEPAVCALCHLLNQPNYPMLNRQKQQVRERFLHDPAFNSLRWSPASEDLSKAVDQLIKLTDLEEMPSFASLCEY